MGRNKYKERGNSGKYEEEMIASKTTIEVLKGVLVLCIDRSSIDYE